MEYFIRIYLCFLFGSHIYYSQRIITLRHKWPGMRILCVCVWCVCVCANMTPWTLRVSKPRAAGLFTLNVLLRFPAQTYHIFQWAVALKITGACSTPGRISSDHPFSKRVVIFKSTGCLFQHFPHWQTKFHPTSACTAAQALVQRYNPSCPWVWMEFGFPASGGPDSARPRWCQSHLLSLDKVYLSAPPLYFLKII